MNKALITLSAVFFFACIATSCSEKKQSETTPADKDTTTVTSPYDLKDDNRQGEEQSAFGVTIDRAMNSITVLTADGDTLSFSYPETGNPGVLARSHVGDSVTVKYIKTGDRDSLTAVFRGYRP